MLTFHPPDMVEYVAFVECLLLTLFLLITIELILHLLNIKSNKKSNKIKVATLPPGQFFNVNFPIIKIKSRVTSALLIVPFSLPIVVSDCIVTALQTLL